MKAVEEKVKKRLTGREKQRRGLLAKVHIAKKELGLDDGLYRTILINEFGMKSAGALSVKELQDLVRYFESKGWVGKKSRVTSYKKRDEGQAAALRERAREMAAELENGEKRLRGLVKKICGVERLEWCGEAVRLKRLLKVLGKLEEREGGIRL